MAEYPSEDEEFELRYQDELEVLNDIDCNNEKDFTSKQNTQNISKKSVLESPKLSQILCENNSLRNAPVNRCLFSGGQRVSSTPLAGKQLPQPKKSTFLNTDLNQKESFNPEDVQNKRRLERDLFGDIDDLFINETYEDPISKKAKTEEQRDLDSIEKILEIRRRMCESSKTVRTDNFLRLQALHAFKIQNLSYKVPQWPFLKLYRSDNKRLFIRYHSDDYENRALENMGKNSNFSGLLGDNKDKIWAGANEIILRKTNSEKIVVNTHVVEASEKDIIQESEVSACLWVEKYKPRKYIDLLSDEMTNRSLLYWLRMWDKVVFGKTFKSMQNNVPANQLNSFNKRTGKFESNGGWRQRRTKQLLNTCVDEIGRPVQKVAILCGPPGLGKTTLAHTIARHAGYSVREINASDDRSPEAFKLALENGTQMSSVLNEQKKPNCIILDEIDGAPRQSIEFLVKFVTDNVVNKIRRKGNKAPKNILKRPIICICNDIYDPALRPLRQIAFTVTFPPIDSERLAERLQQIAQKEHLKTDFGSLIALAEKSGCDVRSCISSMQFFNAQKKALTLHDVLSSSIGQKDRHQGLFDIWGAIFRIQRPRKQLEPFVKNNNDSEMTQITMTDMSVRTRYYNVLDVVHSCGDYERIMQGVYENFLQQKMPDPNFYGIVEALQWFCFSDNVLQKINQQQNYIVYPYLQFGFVMWHLLFASLAWPKISFPSRGFEFNQKAVAQRNIFLSFRKGIASTNIGVGQNNALKLETIPLLKRILSPQMRSVAVQLLSSKEKDNLKQTIEIMVDMGLNYTQVKTSEGPMLFQMEPDLDTLCHFGGYTGISLTYFSRQLIAREVDLERIRRATPKLSCSEIKVKTKDISSTQIKFQNHLQSLKPKSLSSDTKKKAETEVISKDFFGRVRKKMETSAVEKSKTDLIVKSPIWYRHKEGFNNAVRRDVYIHELLL